MASDLWASDDPQKWQEVLDNYWEIVAKIPKDRLLELERWFQEELPDIIEKNSKLSAPELVRLVEWKVGQRGKWRPRLLDFAKALSEGAVADASLKSFKVLSKYGKDDDVPASVLKEALAPLTELRGIGPATASAALSAAHSSIPFMSDEAMMGALGSKDYTVKAAVQLTEALQKKAQKLSKGGDKKWTARVVEKCLFAAAQAAAPAKGSQGKKPAQKRKR